MPEEEKEEVYSLLINTKMYNLTKYQRETYRLLRKAGFDRREANLVIFGMTLEQNEANYNFKILSAEKIS